MMNLVFCPPSTIYSCALNALVTNSADTFINHPQPYPYINTSIGIITIMSATTNFSYHRLINHKETNRELKPIRTRWQPLRLKIKKRLKMKKIPSLRRKARVVIASLMKRLKDSQSHFGDLFAGNYMFLQVTPTPLKSASHAIVMRQSMKKIQEYRLC